MHLLVFGCTGQVATELCRFAGPKQWITALSRDQADLTDPARCAAWIMATDADAVINAAAFTDVDRAETEQDEAMLVNGVAPGVMAKAAKERRLPFLHISTDYVFNGSKDCPWHEDDATFPLNVYGRSKLVGEEAVRTAGGAHIILRTGWVFSVRGNNFLRTMLRVGAQEDQLMVVDDQHGGPTPAKAIAKALITIAQTFAAGHGITGTFHFIGRPPTTWYGFAHEIFTQTGWVEPTEITPISTKEWTTRAARPINSVLDCSRIRQIYGIEQPDWREALGPILEALKGTT